MPRRAVPSALRGSGLPSKTSEPSVATMPEIARSVVVLPAPFAPSSATISPSSTVSEMPCTAATCP